MLSPKIGIIYFLEFPNQCPMPNAQCPIPHSPFPAKIK
ncbi:hypothetical protein COO91_02735 [Nostoc flagelliforme CCNUN1]|uniref:Uncharacterized protein n=1 Tax=Nostoc flagelliforme CCNUN1 TaxID=2038116 RepID=A0A2K8SN73_9NOSO|nr:hypothetical protein COO91_02735 [Nostoc flagelliforme CCNUN1]